MKDLGIVSQLRGMDGAGIYEVNSRAYAKGWGQETLNKVNGDFNYFLWQHVNVKSNKSLGSLMSDVIMGHCRAATMGVYSVDNAQPIKHGTVVGCHNGTLNGDHFLHEERSDSNILFEDIAHHGLESVLRGLDHKDAYAITMYDTNSRNLIFVRNDKRTLYWALNQDRKVLYWASEIGALRYILQRRGVIYQKTVKKGEEYQTTGGIFNLKDGQIFITNSKLIGNSNEPFLEGPVLYTKDDKGKITYTQPVEEEKVIKLSVTVKQQEQSHVIHFPFTEKCNLCQKVMKPLELHKARKFEKGYYDESKGLYWCDECMTGTREAVH